MLLGGRAGLLGMNPFPIVGARIHPPLMRADTLSRERLNGWLDQAATGRVALVVAEAGFGKTTLLGDWARSSPRLTAWYRLDPDDRDWLTFYRHLVAGGRELDPDFAPETYALLMQLGPGGPTRDGHPDQPRQRVRRVRRQPPAGHDADPRRLPRRRRQRRGRAHRPRADRADRPGVQHRDRLPIDASAAARPATGPRRGVAHRRRRPLLRRPRDGPPVPRRLPPADRTRRRRRAGRTHRGLGCAPEPGQRRPRRTDAARSPGVRRTNQCESRRPLRLLGRGSDCHPGDGPACLSDEGVDSHPGRRRIGRAGVRDGSGRRSCKRSEKRRI